MRPGRLIRSAIVLKPSTLLSFHRTLKNRKYRLLFSLKLRKKPGSKGPDPEVIAAVVEMKQRNPMWGCPRIAQQIALAFDIRAVPGTRCADDVTPFADAAGKVSESGCDPPRRSMTA